MTQEIDILIATEIMKWTSPDGYQWFNKENQPTFLKIGPDGFHPSENLKHAWKVVEHIRKPNSDNWSQIFINHFRNADIWSLNANEAALKICEMALKTAGIDLYKRIEELMEKDPKMNTPEGRELKNLAEFVEKLEEQQCNF